MPYVLLYVRSIYIFFPLKFPSPLNISSIIQHGLGEYTVFIHWLAPRYDGGVGIDSYILILVHDDIAVCQKTTTDTVDKSELFYQLHNYITNC